MTAWRDLGTAWRRGPRVWGDLVRASWELAHANRRFRRLTPRELHVLDSGPDGPEQALSASQRALVERVAYALPVMGLRMPWRSDCLVQAVAARRWLASAGVAADICLGVVKDEADFRAHAWSKVGERIVTGGDVAEYAQLPPARGRPGLTGS